MKINLDKTDKKLLSYSYHHYREPFTEIAKACKISRDQAEYRLKKYEGAGLIKKYATVFDYSALGYNEFIVLWIKLETRNKKQEIRKELQKDKNVFTYFDVIGKYDIGCDLIYRNKKEFQKKFGEFLEKHKNKIKDYSIFITTFSSFFPMKEFGFSKSEEEFVLDENSQNNNKLLKLDEKEIEIMKMLSENGREKIVNIAKATGLSGEAVKYKMKQLKNKGIILGTRIVLDMEKLGYFFGVIRIKISAFTEELKKRLFEYCKNHKQVNALFLGIGDYDCLIQIFYKEEEQFRNSIKDIMNEFESDIRDIDTILIENEGDVNTLPF